MNGTRERLVLERMIELIHGSVLARACDPVLDAVFRTVYDPVLDATRAQVQSPALDRAHFLVHASRHDLFSGRDTPWTATRAEE